MFTKGDLPENVFINVVRPKGTHSSHSCTSFELSGNSHQHSCEFPVIIKCCFLPQANLPLLQRELLHCARLAKQNPAQYLAQHEQLLLDTSTTSPVDSSELLLDVNENGKRRTPDRWVTHKTRTSLSNITISSF